MKVEIRVPRMGESITEAIVGAILKPNGSMVNMDEEVLELETDKVNQAVYAPKKGLLTLTVKEGDKVPIDSVIGFVETSGTVQQAEQPKETAPEKEPRAQEPAKAANIPIPEPQKETAASLRFTEKEFIEELLAPPPVSKQASKAPQEQPQKKESAAPPPAGSETRKKMSTIRKVIAQRLVETQQQAAMLTTFNEADMSVIIELRTKYQEAFTKKHGVKLGFMSFFVKAAVSALQAFPLVNSYIDGDDIVERHYYNLSIAVSTDKGLIVPVIKNCDSMSMAEIEKSLEDYAKKAREGKITVDELRGGGFTITNGGVFGSLLSTPFLNLPQCAILGMHKIEKRPVVVDDQIVIRPMMYLALSYDHRLIDGKEAVSFLVHIKNMLENPPRILLEV